MYVRSICYFKTLITSIPEFLIKCVRRVIPYCAVKKISDTFPSSDSIYTGFMDGRLVDENNFS